MDFNKLITKNTILVALGISGITMAISGIVDNEMDFVISAACLYVALIIVDKFWEK